MDRTSNERAIRSPPKRMELMQSDNPVSISDCERLHRQNEELRGRVRKLSEQHAQIQSSLEGALRLAEQRCREQQIELKAYAKYIDDLQNKLVELSSENDQMRDRLTVLQKPHLGDSQYAELLDEVERWRAKLASADRNHQLEMEQLRSAASQQAEAKIKEVLVRFNQERATHEKQVQELRALLLRTQQRGAVAHRVNTSVSIVQHRQVSPNSTSPTEKVQPRSRIVSLQEQFQQLRSKVKMVQQRNQQILQKMKNKRLAANERQQS